MKYPNSIGCHINIKDICIDDTILLQNYISIVELSE